MKMSAEIKQATPFFVLHKRLIVLSNYNAETDAVVRDLKRVWPKRKVAVKAVSVEVEFTRGPITPYGAQLKIGSKARFETA